MTYVALVTLLLLIQYLFFTMRAGMARGKDTVVAPATSGEEGFERRFRVQMNTLEQLMIVLPAMWLCAHYFRADVAAAAGLLFLAARFLYSAQYLKDPSTRAPGMIIGMLATLVLLLCSAYGIITML